MLLVKKICLKKKKLKKKRFPEKKNCYLKKKIYLKYIFFEKKNLLQGNFFFLNLLKKILEKNFNTSSA